VEHILKQLGCKQAKQGRPQQNPDNDFTDGRRLADALRDGATDTGRQHNHGKLQQGEEQQRFGFVGGDVSGCCHGF